MDSFIINYFRDFSLGGDYRNILVRPNDLKYEIKTYTEKNKDLTQSDWDMLKQNLKSHSNKDDISESEKEASITSEMKAIIIEYSLPSSSYATMALREVLQEN